MNDMNEKESINQTQFSFEEPIFENQAVYSEEKPDDENLDKKKSKKKTIILVGIGIFIILITLLIFLTRNGNGIIEDIIEPPVQDVPKELSPLQLRIEDARELLNLADPTKQDLAFPPIDLNLRLDPKER